MDDDQLAALRGSIEKWRRIVSGDGEDQGAKNCPLCVAFDQHSPDFEEESNNTDCQHCPVAQPSGKHYGCQGTPYDAWHRHQTTAHPTFNSPYMNQSQYKPFPHRVECDECRRLARYELDFLVALLPEGETA